MKKGLFIILLFVTFVITSRSVYAKTVEVSDYNSLKAEIENAVDGDVINVNQSFTFDTCISIAKNLTINLNGNTVSTPRNFVFATGVKDVVIKNGVIEAPYGGVSTSSGTLKLENINITGSDSLVSIQKNGSVIIDKDSVINATGNTNYPAIQVTGSYTEESKYNPYLYVYGTINAGNETAILGNGKDKNISHIYVYEGAKITSNNLVFYLPQPCDVNITGGIITSNKKSVFGIKSGTLNITGGEITAHGNSNDNLNTNGSGIEINGSVIHIDSNGGYIGNTSINISGKASLKSEYKSIIKEIGAVEEKTSVVDINISGGEFSSNTSYPVIDVRDITKDKVSVTGGVFNSKVDNEFLNNNYVQNKNENGTYIVELASIKTKMPIIDKNKIKDHPYIIFSNTNQNILLNSISKNNIDISFKNIIINVEEHEINEDGLKEVKAIALKNNLIVENGFELVGQVIDSDTNNLLGTIDELTENVDIEIILPDELKKSDRKYYVIREYNEKIDILDTKVSKSDKNLTFTSDKLSKYTLAYKNIDDRIENPDTGYNKMNLQIMIIVNITLFVLVLATVKIIKKDN